MRNRTPLAPGEPAFDVTVHIVLNDFGDRLGRAYCETDEAADDETSIIENILDGEYSCPMRVVASQYSRRLVTRRDRRNSGEAARPQCARAHAGSIITRFC